MKTYLVEIVYRRTDGKIDKITEKTKAECGPHAYAFAREKHGITTQQVLDAFVSDPSRQAPDPRRGERKDK